MLSWGLLAWLCCTTAAIKATWKIPNGEDVVRFAGKMNVPAKGTNLTRDNPGHPVFWPGLNGQGIFLQPVLQDGGKRPEWRMYSEGWSPSCAPGVPRVKCACTKPTYKFQYCWDAGVNGVAPGTVISWYMAKKEPRSATNTDWVSGFVTSAGERSEMEVRFPVASNSSKGYLTALLQEGHYTALDQVPRGTVEVWDMVVRTSQGRVLSPVWGCDKPTPKYQFSQINCKWTDGTRSGVQITFGHSA
eukprot:NODE_1945_length_802_cov_66.725100_g1541_i0.p1 GENE.NODE_1945_length_802_cov_66.725100_g1541_i0~~NODE_1945_length_802_cov_66.725100_g1541_i0.p1  ORF type:complete len:264 (+),score=66.52 NODE_1945_length_802_cov_66.725100_g1541_i0:58-792(+)